MIHSLPQELLTSLESVKGFELGRFLEAHEHHASVSIRYNTHKFHSQHQIRENSSLHITSVPWSADSFYLSERPVFTLDPTFHAGAYYVQEASSMFIDFLWKSLWKESVDLKVLDLCAAPGGKTTLLSGLPGIKMILANEIIKSRVSVLYENVVKWGDPKILVSNNDPSDLGRLQSFFDVMLVDAPCSGSGLFRKDPDAIGEWSIDAVKLCSERQKRILADALPALKENGILMYATCSYSTEENEGVMDWLISQFDMEPIGVDIPADWGIIEATSTNGGIGYRFMPYRLEGEGFFISCFRQTRAHGEHYLKEKKYPSLSAKEQLLMHSWMKNPEGVECIKTKEDHVLCIPSDFIQEQLILAENLHLRKSGLLAGQLIRDQFLPEHELSQSILINEGIPTISLDKKNALDYLRKMTIELPAMPKGWYLVDYGGFHLGWIKHLGNRINNYYPASWRILMS